MSLRSMLITQIVLILLVSVSAMDVNRRKAMSKRAQLTTCLSSTTVEVIPRNHPKYPEYNYNKFLIINVRPKGFLVPANIPDLKAIIRCTRKFDIKVTIKCGGHAFEKYSFGDSTNWVIDVRKFNEIKVDKAKGIAVVGSGNTINDLAMQAIDHGFSIPCPEDPTVGISGFTLGGGVGFMFRSEGLMIQHVIEVKVVTEKGELLTANSVNNSDLFWALRGAGAQSFGVVTEFTFKLRPLPEVIAIRKFYHVSKFPDIFRNWSKMVDKDIDESITSVLSYLNETVMLKFFVRSINESQNMATLSMIKSIFTDITDNDIKYQTYRVARDKFMFEYAPEYFKTVDFFIKRTLTDQDRETFIKAFEVNRFRYLFMFLRMLRGKMKENKDNAFIHGDAYFHVVFDMLIPADIGQAAAQREIPHSLTSMNNFLNATKSMDSGYSFQNYEDNNRTDWRYRYYGREGYHKLVEIKKKHAPDGYFGCPHCI